jgi:hypothetical protein
MNFLKSFPRLFDISHSQLSRVLFFVSHQLISFRERFFLSFVLLFESVYTRVSYFRPWINSMMGIVDPISNSQVPRNRANFAKKKTKFKLIILAALLVFYQTCF